MNSLYNVIKKFVVTNKSTDGEVRGVYTCMVDMAATKIDIKNAMKSLYAVETAKVNILHTHPKFRRTKTGIGRRQGIEKKAMITLKDGQKIVNFEAVK